MNSATIQIPALRCTQGGIDYYQCSFTVKDAIKLFQITDPELPVEERAQREISLTRAKRFGQYVNDNSKYTAPPVIVSANIQEIEFLPINPDSQMGAVVIPLDTEIYIIDGQHRIKGFEFALENDPDLEHDTISVILHANMSLKHRQQMFSDINYNQKPVSSSLSKVYNDRSPTIGFAKSTINKSWLKGLVEFEKSVTSKNSRKIYTFSQFLKVAEKVNRFLESKNVDYIKRIGIFTNALAKLERSIQPISDLTSNTLTTQGFRDLICGNGVFLEVLGLLIVEIIERDLSQDFLKERFSGFLYDRTESPWNGVMFDSNQRLIRGSAATVAGIFKDALKD